jgi:GntR family transcriptional regulator/MocR family aminotransferase
VTRSGPSGAGSDFLTLDVTAAPPGGRTTWLADELRAAILRGQLRTGARLPATRTLADELGVARGVVVQAYQRLLDEGLVVARTGVGTLVLPVEPPAVRRTRPSVGPGDRVKSANSVSSVAPATDPVGVPRLPLPIGDELAPDAIDLSPGVPDLAAFPRAAWLRAERQVLQDLSAADLGYGDPRGSARLRAELSGWLARHRGVRADPGQILVVAGVAQALALLAQILRSRGSTAIAVEDPGSRGAREQAAHWGLRPVPIPVDENGLQVSALERAEVEVALLTPAHQFPTGVVLSPERRRALLEWARAGRLIVEDDYDAEHRYDRAPVRALQPSAPEQVLHTGSTSKTLAPGMRLGWLVPPADLYPELVAARHANDLGSPALPQLVLAELLSSGGYERHLRLVRNRQRRRRDAMLAALAEFLPGARVEGAAAGLHLLITLPGLPIETDDTELATAVRHAGVRVHPLSWHRVRPGIPGLVLGYAAHPPDRLQSAVRRMAAALPKELGHHPN